MDAAAIDRKKKKRREYRTAYRLAKNGPSTGVKKIHRHDGYRIWPTWIATETSTAAKTRVMNPTPIEVEDMAEEDAPCTAFRQSPRTEDSRLDDEQNRQSDAELLSLMNELQETDKVDKPSLKFSETWKSKHKVKTVGLSKVSSNESTKRSRRQAVMELLGKLQRDSGGEFILFSRYPNKKKVSSFVEILGTNAKKFMSSEVGMGVEKIWHRDSDKMQSERNKSPADASCDLSESESHGNSIATVSQEDSLSVWNNQTELALIDGSLAESDSVSDDPTAYSLQEDNGPLSNNESEQWILIESGDQPPTEVEPVIPVGVVPQRMRVIRPNQQVRGVGPKTKARQTCNGPSVKYILQKSKEAATAPLPNPPAPQRPQRPPVSINRSHSAPMGRSVSLNSQARLIKVIAVPPGSKITSIVLPSSSK